MEYGSKELFNSVGGDLSARTTEDIITSVGSPWEPKYEMRHVFVDHTCANKVRMKGCYVLVA